jgi:hypothetical protein
MTQAWRPAAFIRAVPGPGTAATALDRQAVADAARQRGWPAPTVYADEDGADDTALARLEAAIVAGRHDVLMLAGQGAVSGGGPALLMGLLLACTKNGVIVELLPPPLAAGGEAVIPEPPGLSRPAARSPEYPQRPAVLTRARVSAMSQLYPGWRIWLDDHGWHARRRDGIFLQEFRHGAPAFCVHAVSEEDLARRLRDQEATDAKSPGRAAS